MVTFAEAQKQAQALDKALKAQTARMTPEQAQVAADELSTAHFDARK